ncbi:hypothetical protein F5878DRAFT_662909 [Lentinula raphanica]|uniref:Uncharacterized protein n=1 Tax=Lentinula raphanica TaxID=153919 RepID=A0AA38UCI8_9AGAR|nr:hypothetical protein F5880DRAFT_1610693 [Lentinula raphanica]KAJ3836520.1 hypothetical protein F5878DRAFT_662909 [Lentinula raphanica]
MASSRSVPALHLLRSTRSSTRFKKRDTEDTGEGLSSLMGQTTMGSVEANRLPPLLPRVSHSNAGNADVDADVHDVDTDAYAHADANDDPHNDTHPHPHPTSALLRAIDRLRTTEDVFDGMLDTVGGKDVREASRRFLSQRSTNDMDHADDHVNGGVDTQVYEENFATLLGDTPSHPLPSGGKSSIYKLRSLGWDVDGGHTAYALVDLGLAKLDNREIDRNRLSWKSMAAICVQPSNPVHTPSTKTPFFKL